MKILRFISFWCVVFPTQFFGQDISLFQQLNGRYDYTAIGNTLNIIENEALDNCTILTSSTATLDLQPNQNIIAAYLYWAGSGGGDFDIRLNTTPISADRIFNTMNYNGRDYFAAFSNITALIQNQGNGNYTVSDFDLTDIIPNYCINGTNFGGWAIIIIYEDDILPLNQVNIYDGLQRVPTQISITLENLNVLDNEDAKIGFLAWEGDAALAINETLTINGNPISNLPLNPANNAFNGTNSFTGNTDLFNMDIDVYNIQNNINVGDTTATIELTSGQDFVMVNNIITVLNSQLPDASIALDDYFQNCGENHIEVDYTVNNTNATDVLPAATPIAFYYGNMLIGQSFTQNELPIDGSESGTTILTLPEDLEGSFELIIIVDDDGNQNGVVTENNEGNNITLASIELLPIPSITTLPNLLACNLGFGTGNFNLLSALPVTIDGAAVISFYRNLEDFEGNVNALFSPDTYVSISNPQTIYVKVEGLPCFDAYQFDVMVENCPPYVPEGLSPNGDSLNDWFNILGLYDIFLEHQLVIYNRYGTLIFEGNNASPWDGKSNRGLNNTGKLLPVGTYFYILHLNDSNYKPIQGWVYLNY